MLQNNLGRKIDYLRISVTDRCNLRCMYCMPRDGMIHRPQEEILTFEEIERAVRIFASIGIKKIRLTGGEVMVRKNVINLIRSFYEITGLEQVSLTTNGTLLYAHAEELKRSGVKGINISLDTLKRGRFEEITGTDSIHSVLEGIERARALGFNPLKLNVVVMRGINDDEIVDFMDFAFSRGIIPRFIEFMNVTPLWKKDFFLPIEETMRICKNHLPLEKIGSTGPGPAVYYKAKGGGLLGFIKTDESNCRMCTRLRLTSTGELKSCLYETDGFILRDFLRDGFSDEEIRSIIERRMDIKRCVDYRTYKSQKSYMCSIGG